MSALNGTNDEIGRKAILKLMDAVDEYIPDPVRQLDKPFLMPIEDVFSIQVFRRLSVVSCMVFICELLTISSFLILYACTQNLILFLKQSQHLFGIVVK